MTFDPQFIKNLKEKIDAHRDLYQKNEAAVRQHLIDPVLRELGWNIEDPDQVLPEDSTGEGGFPDYSLLQDGKKIILIEAKKLSADPMAHLKQLARYSTDIGSKYGLITNGSEYVLFKAFEEFKPYIDRLIWKINIESDPVERIIRNLTSVSPNNIMRIEELAKKSENLNILWDELIEDPETFSRILSDYFKKQLASRFQRFNYDDDEVQEFLKEKAFILLSQESLEGASQDQGSIIDRYSSKYYTKMRIQGKEFQISAQNQILINVANWLVEKGKLNRNTVPIEAGPKRYLINRENKNKDGSLLPGGKAINGGLWIMLNLSSSNIVRMAYKLLEKFGYENKILELE